jgi:ABC-type multidrug transport system fused ATPase/permease subunit
MGFFRVLALAGPTERRMLQRAIAFKILESLFAAAPLGIAYLVAAALLGDPRAAAWLPGEGGSALRIAGVAGLLAACLGLQFLFCYLTNLEGYTAGYRLSADLRIRVADHLRRLPMSFYDRREPGELAHVLMQDVMAVEMIPGTVLPRLVAALTLPAIGLAVALWWDWRLGLALVLALPLALPALLWGYRTLRRTTAEQAAALIELNARLIEFIRGIAVIRAFGLTGDRQGRVAAAVDRFRATAKALVAGFVAPTILYPVLLGLGPVAVLAGGAWLVQSGELSLAAWLLLVLLGLRLFGALGELLDFSALVLQMDNALGRITALLDEPAAGQAAGAVAPEGFAIAFEDVRFDYRAVPAGDGLGEIALRPEPERIAALEGVSLAVPERSMVALVGHSGAGKTTLVRLLQRHWQPQGGRITIGGADLAAWPDDRLQGLISVVSQRITLFTETVRDNIRLGRTDADEDAVVAAAKAARCHDFILGLPEGYDTVLANGGALLSGGERQRLALARAFLQDSRIIILDEVTSALDVENERLVQAALDDLLRDRTVIIIAHRLWTVRRADQILVLEGGRIVERGGHDALIAQGGAYQRLWQDLADAPGWQC